MEIKNFFQKIQSSIFKSYDIRGIYPSQINKEVAFFVGRGFVRILNKSHPKIIVGMDNRLSSPLLKKYLIKGITQEGGEVIDIGLSTTPLFYFSASYFKGDGGIIITASHNSWEYNGFKMVLKDNIPLSGKEFLEKLKKSSFSFKTRKAGKVIKKKALTSYIKFNFEVSKVSKLSPLKVVVDTANSVAIVGLREFFKKTPLKVHYLFSKLDGRFPHHLPDPLKKENLKFLREQIIKKKADLGIAFDGDGDRILFLDEKGRIIRADIILAFLSKVILKERKKEKILYDVRCSNIVRETIKKNGGKGVMSRVGHFFIKKKMREENIFFGGEFSGHFYLKDNQFCETPLFVLLKILNQISLENTSLSKLTRPFFVYFHSGEINLKVKSEQKILKALKALKEKFKKKGKMCLLDGVRVDFKNWWFNVRPSNTEPLLRIIVEAKSKKLLKQKTKEILHFIKSIK